MKPPDDEWRRPRSVVLEKHTEPGARPDVEYIGRQTTKRTQEAMGTAGLSLRAEARPPETGSARLEIQARYSVEPPMFQGKEAPKKKPKAKS